MNNREHQKIFTENITKNGFVINEKNNKLSFNLKGRIHGALRDEIEYLDFGDECLNMLSKDIAESIIDHHVFSPLQYIDSDFFKANLDRKEMSLMMDCPKPFIKYVSSNDFNVSWKFTVLHGVLYIIMKIKQNNSSDVHCAMASIDLVEKHDPNHFMVKNVKPLYNVFLESQGMSKHVKCDEIIEDEHKLSLRSHAGNGPREYNVAYTSIFGWSVSVL